MEILTNLLHGFATVLQPLNLFFLVVGLVLGLVVAVLPGLTLVMGVVPLLLALSWGGRDYAWASPQIVSMLMAGVAMLGVEAGTSVFDLDDTARTRTAALLTAEPGLNFDDVERRVLKEYEDRIFYRVISPRHFEAAAFRVTQILYRGHYSGVMEPDVHYLALEKDFSNFDEVMARFSDPAERKRITDRAYDDLIASGRWSYESFIASVDRHLADATGLDRTLPISEQQLIADRLRRGATLGRWIAHPRWFLRNVPFPGRAIVAAVYRQVRSALDAR